MALKSRVSSTVAAWRHLMAILLLAAAMPVVAKVRVVNPGEVPVLRPDEGLLLIGVDTNLPLTAVSFRFDSKRTSDVAATLSRVGIGHLARLYVVPAGAYRWSQIDTQIWTRFGFDEDSETDRFIVVPGKINYGGDLLYRWTDHFHADIQIHDRSLRAMDWLDMAHPALARQYPFAYNGHYPDPFPDVYRAARASTDKPLTEISAVNAPPRPVAMPLQPHDLWREDRVTHVELNPAGDLLAESSKLDESHWTVDLIDLKAQSAIRLINSPVAVESVVWTGDRVLLLGVSGNGGAEVMTVVHIQDRAAGTRKFEAVRLDPIGKIISTIVDDPDHILYAVPYHSLVYKRDISSRSAINGSLPEPLNLNINNDVAWWADGVGRLRLVLAPHDQRYGLWYGPGDGSFKFLMDGDESLVPQSLSVDGTLLYAISDKGSSQRDLVVYDIKQKRITRTLFSKPGVDVASVLFDDRKTPIGVTYFQEGRSVSEYFDSRNAALTELLQRTFPGRTVSIVSRSRNGSQLVLQVEASDDPPKLYLLDVPNRRASLLDEERPWLDGKAMAPSQLVTATSTDGLKIESYLTLPQGEGKHPLIVLPHGGPVGVSDRLLFNPESQFFASLGYAVLRVNYRGSDGYGKAFREAGQQAQGTRIEDDVEAAVTQALARFPLDADRMCIVGSSYGGYSALVSTIRWPHRFKCAVSISGVSDRFLAFSATDGGQSNEGRKELERIFGDPVKDRQAMLANSPIYHWQDLRVPLMLVHGREDMRVDYEHALRLVRMLDIAGQKPVMLTMETSGHGWDDMEKVDQVYSGIAGFLQQYLGTPAAQASPATALIGATMKAPSEDIAIMTDDAAPLPYDARLDVPYRR
jgi:dipeptidyl aminopeptidase/acylaminoacyl peptidase